jgi:hypothetical protein
MTTFDTAAAAAAALISIHAYADGCTYHVVVADDGTATVHVYDDSGHFLNTL